MFVKWFVREFENIFRLPFFFAAVRIGCRPQKSAAGIMGLDCVLWRLWFRSVGFPS
jgi:hypothetical protein